MVKCAIFALQAFQARFNASLLIRVILLHRVSHRLENQQPQHRKHGGYITRNGVNTLFHHFLVFVVDFLALQSYREAPGGTRDQHCGAAGVCNLRLTVCDILL